MIRSYALLLFSTTTAFAQAKPEDLIVVREGAIPIILSAPHGGRKAIPDAIERKGEGVVQFVTVRDDNTDALAEKIAANLEKSLGGKPFVVIAKFERKYADANRAAANAYESDAAKPVYDYYHKSIKSAREAIDKKWGDGLLLDIHGQGAEVNTIFRGTAKAKSVKYLLDRHGEEALSGPKSIFGYLAKHEVKVEPAPGSKAEENKQFNGGYIVQTYGSADGGRIDAIQMEFGTNLRSKLNLDATAKTAADAIAVYAKEYLSFAGSKKEKGKK